MAESSQFGLEYFIIINDSKLKTNFEGYGNVTCWCSDYPTHACQTCMYMQCIATCCPNFKVPNLDEPILCHHHSHLQSITKYLFIVHHVTWWDRLQLNLSGKQFKLQICKCQRETFAHDYRQRSHARYIPNI